MAIKCLMALLLLISISQNATSQGCTNCNSADVKIVTVSLQYDQKACPDSNTIITNGKINVSLTVNSKARYGFYMYYELWIDGKPAIPTYYKKCFPAILPQGVVNLPLIDLPPFVAYQKVEIRNVLTAWDNNTSNNGTYFCDNLDGYSCNIVAPKCKYYSAAFPIKVDFKPSISSIITNNNICPGATATFNIKGTPLSKIFYQLDNISDSLTLDSTGAFLISKPNATSDVILNITSIASDICSSDLVNTSATVKVNSVANPGSIIGSQRICFGTDPTIIVSSQAASGIGTIRYQWQKRTVSSSTWINVPGASGESLDDNSLIFEETFYRRVSIADGCNEIPSNEILVSLFQLNGGTVSGDQTICPNGVPTAFTSIDASTGGKLIAYQWQKSFDSGVTWVDIQGANLLTFQETESITVTTLYRRKVESLFTDKICTAFSNTLKVDLIELNASGNIEKDQIICPLGDPSTFISSTPRLQSIGSVTYQWQSSTDGGNWTDIPNATEESYDPPARTITTKTFFRRAMLISVNVSGCSTDYSNAVSVSVTELQSAGTITADQVVCTGSAPLTLQSQSDASVIDGKASYQWQTSSDGNNWSNLEGAINNTLSPSSITNATYFRRMIDAMNSSGSCATDYTNSVKIDVSKIESAGNISADQVICAGSSPTALTSTNTATGLGPVTYRWEYSANDGASWNTIPNANNENYQPFELNSKVLFRRVSGIDLNNEFCNPTPSNVVTVNIGSISNAGSISGSGIVCKGDDAGIISGSDAVTDLNGSISYQWQISSDNGNNWINIIDANNKDLDPSDPIISNTLYRRIALFNISTGEQCAENSYSNIFSINTASLESSGAISASQQICKESTPATLTSVSDAFGSNAIISYTWQSSIDGKSWKNLDGAKDQNYSPEKLSESTYFRRMAHATNGADICESNYTEPVLISITKIEDAGLISGDQVICSSDNSSILASNGNATSSGSISYQWEFSTDNGTTWNSISNANENNFIPTGLTTTTKYRRKAIASINGSVCDNAFSNEVTLIVGALFSAGNLTGADLVCVGGNPAPFKADNPVSNTPAEYVKYQWQISVDNGLTWKNIANAINPEYDENTPVWSKTLYRRIASLTTNYGKVCQQQISNQVSIDVRECERCTLLQDYTKGFPNPFKYNFTLRFRSCVTGPAYIELFDFTGAKIQVKKFPNVQAGEEVSYEFFIPQSITGVIYKITTGKYSTVGRMITAY